MRIKSMFFFIILVQESFLFKLIHCSSYHIRSNFETNLQFLDVKLQNKYLKDIMHARLIF